MGYTHYWYRPMQIAPVIMTAIVTDFNKVVLALDDMGVKLADGMGKNTPKITVEEIWFNGAEDCGHEANQEISIPWPAPGARGVNKGEKVVGGWFAGALLGTRTCNGDCSYETVHFPAQMPKSGFISEHEQHKGLFFQCCKTAYRPYDLAVTAFLIIAKKHMGKDIYVSSDGDDENWEDARRILESFVEYGNAFHMRDAGMVEEG